MIYCIGDSFTYGDELLNRTQDCWPTLLGKRLSAEVKNLGKPASSNSRIVKRAMDAAFAKDSDIIIIAWSNPIRLELVDDYGVFNSWPGKKIPFFEHQHKRDVVKLLTMFFTNKYEWWAHRRWLREIILLQAFLEHMGQKYIMLQSHESQFFNRQWVVESDRHRDLSQHVKTEYFVGWPLDGIVEWIGESPRGQFGHPLEEGHVKVADKIYEHIRTLGWI